MGFDIDGNPRIKDCFTNKANCCYVVTNRISFYDRNKILKNNKKISENELYTTCIKKLNSCSVIPSYKGAYLK